MSATGDTDKIKGQRKPQAGVAGEIPWGPVLSGPCEDNKPEYTTPGRAAGTPEQVTAQFDQRVQQGQYAVRTLYQDGHHPADRDNLTDMQIGVQSPTSPHEHDDWKRSPPEVIDQDPQSIVQGDYAEQRVPLSGGSFWSGTPGDKTAGKVEKKGPGGK